MQGGDVPHSVLARCITKAAPAIIGSYYYVTALRFRCRMLLEAMLVTKRTPTHAHVSSASHCLQVANERRSSTMPICKGAKSWVLLYTPLLFALQNFAAVPFNVNWVVCTCNI